MSQREKMKKKKDIQTKHPIALGLILAGLSAFMFSSKVVLAKWAYAQSSIEPIHLLVLRMGSIAPIFIAIAIWASIKSGRFITLREGVAIVFLGACGYHFSSFLDFEGMQYISAGLERMVLYIFPSFVVILNSWKQKKPISIYTLPSLALSYLGIFLMYRGDMDGPSQNRILGIALVAAAALVFSVFIVYSKDMMNRLGQWKFTSLAVLSATTGLMLQYVYGHHGNPLAVSTSVLVGASMMGVFCTLIPSFLSNFSLQILGAERMAIMGTVGPIATLILSGYVLGEKTEGLEWFGMSLVLVGALSFQVNWVGYIKKTCITQFGRIPFLYNKLRKN